MSGKARGDPSGRNACRSRPGRAGLRVQVETGISGVLCNPDAWQDMANRSVELLADPESRNRIGVLAKQRIKEKFSWHQHASRLDSFYRESLEQNH